MFYIVFEFQELGISLQPDILKKKYIEKLEVNIANMQLLLLGCVTYKDAQ